ncbi:GH36 C-terminal domain-containing protein [Actinoplanes xinjiangensis]|uniref:Glycosyl hydrolase family 36 C-terminal domain-containing protein n=1 Tax=Actinoplanes xinjiangensis TaxID=512350 RepID=A0A316ELK7_9ACTN|nr:GH36 C-terminal domain-containing protein [Actinoplanes xinjiangensis]PWK31686.1 hypothetical protein BC793_13235 [Actinoplanes xinjiangensis]GIF43941.1 hypothetical protein Axi01nite_82520 [Actinoplanes xinjiangensis]
MDRVLGIGADVARWTADERAEARSLVDDYKRIRRTVQHGHQYRLGGVPGAERSAVQYVLGDQAAVLVYNPLGNAKNGPRRLTLAGLEPDATYEVALGGSATPAPAGSPTDPGGTAAFSGPSASDRRPGNRSAPTTAATSWCSTASPVP